MIIKFYPFFLFSRAELYTVISSIDFEQENNEGQVAGQHDTVVRIVRAKG